MDLKVTLHIDIFWLYTFLQKVPKNKLLRDGIQKKVYQKFQAIVNVQDLSPDQLFFLNFAQVWCGTARPEALRYSHLEEHVKTRLVRGHVP